ncbi:MAG TPA: hypothetical protein VFS48_07095 [Solirubrobacterales bacterium]|nr:hypothetical protein [Solirubrobacterales bacterium]
MVAVRGLRGEDEQQATQRQAGAGGQLGVETVFENRRRSGEARRLLADVEASGTVDEEDHGEAEQPEHQDDTAEPPATGAGCDRGQSRRQHRNRDQQVGVGLSGDFGVDGGGRGGS